MFKKIICLPLVFLMLTVSVFAAESTASFDVGDNFFTYSIGQDAEKVSKILGIAENELEDYCKENGIITLAVNKDNSLQIRSAVTSSSFSQSIGNLSSLSDSKINAIMPSITGDEKISGEIISHGGQKFVKTHISSSDSGGKYTVIRYATVASKKDYTLTFYTSADLSEDYSQKIFESFSSPDFYKSQKETKPYMYIIAVAIGLLTIGSAYIIYTLIRDIKADKNEEE